MVRCMLVFALVLVLGGCGASSGGEEPGTQTHFMGTCDADDQCGDGFACACGTCTLTCVSDAACAEIEEPTVCVFANVPAFYGDCDGHPGAIPPGVCLPVCEVDADCARWDLPYCNDGACSENPPKEPPVLVPSGSWGQTTGPVGTGRAPIVGTTKGHLFLAGANHLLRSTDGGRGWTEVAKGRAEDVSELDGRLVARFGSSVFASEDGGTSWSSMRGEGLGGEIFALRTGGGRLWAVAAGEASQRAARAAIFVSDDLGASWTALAPLPAEEVVGELFAAEDVVLATGLYSGKLHRSVDGGATWTEVAAKGAGWATRFAAHGGDLFAIVPGARGVFRSGDRGASWVETPLSFGESAGALDLPRLVSAGADLFASPGNGRIYRWDVTLDGWTETEGELRGRISALTGSGDGAWLGVDELLYRWSRTERAWQEVDVSLIETEVVALAEADGMLLASTGGDAVHRSWDQGLSWERSWAGLPVNSQVTQLAVLRGWAWAATAAGEIYLSNDGGTWTRSPVPGVGDGTMRLVRAFAGAGDVVLAATSDPAGIAGQGVMRSIDLGASWEVYDEGLPRAEEGAKEPAALVALVAAGDGETWYAATAAGEVYRSITAGASWVPASTGLEGRVVALAAGAGRVVAAVAVQDASALYELVDGAWSAVDGAVFAGEVRGLAARDGMLAVSIEGEGVRVSFDGGAWMSPGAVEAGPLAMAGAAVFAGTPSAGVWRLDLVAAGQAR